MTKFSFFLNVNKSWKEVWQKKEFRLQVFITIAYSLCLAQFFPPYFDYLELRKGTMLHDVLVEALPVYDVSWIIFICVYSGAVLGIGMCLTYPKRLVMIFQTYALVTTLRIITLYFIPLEPPLHYCAMEEPVISWFFTSNGKICSKDLFFSGHVSTILSVYFSVKQKIPCRILLFFAFVIGAGVLVQHVHYTIDVIFAPFATYGCYLVSKKIMGAREN